MGGTESSIHRDVNRGGTISRSRKTLIFEVNWYHDMQEIHKPGHRDVNRGGTISRSRKTLIFLHQHSCMLIIHFILAFHRSWMVILCPEQEKQKIGPYNWNYCWNIIPCLISPYMMGWTERSIHRNVNSGRDNIKVSQNAYFSPSTFRLIIHFILAYHRTWMVILWPECKKKENWTIQLKLLLKYKQHQVSHLKFNSLYLYNYLQLHILIITFIPLLSIIVSQRSISCWSKFV
jgi:hypothetical protein